MSSGLYFACFAHCFCFGASWRLGQHKLHHDNLLTPSYILASLCNTDSVAGEWIFFFSLNVRVSDRAEQRGDGVKV